MSAAARSTSSSNKSLFSFEYASFRLKTCVFFYANVCIGLFYFYMQSFAYKKSENRLIYLQFQRFLINFANEKYLTKYLNLINFFYEKIYIEDLGDIHAHFSLDAIDGDRCLHI